MDDELVWLFKSMIKVEGKIRHRILLSFFVVEILTTQESVAKLNLQMVISPQQTKTIKLSGVIIFQFYHRLT